jgi:hypothetical protein
MNYELAARLISVQEDEDGFVLAFADDESEKAQYLMLQYSLCPDDQDMRLGLNGLYIERDHQGQGCYRGVSEIRRFDRRIEIYLTESGKQHLRTQHIVITPLPWQSMLDQGLARLAELSRGEYDVVF